MLYGSCQHSSISMKTEVILHEASLVLIVKVRLMSSNLPWEKAYSELAHKNWQSKCFESDRKNGRP